MAAGPLDGVRVLEFSQIVAAPFLGCLLSDLGADVVKVEPPGGDQHRSWGAVVANEGKRFQSLNRGKRGIVLDLGDPRGRDLAQRLVPQFDIVTQNYRRGVARRLGVDYETLRELHPSLIYCEISGWGSKGPMADLGSTDPVAGAFSGLVVAGGAVDGDGLPGPVASTAISDHAAGFTATAGVLAALYHRERTGEGQLVETSLLRSALAIQETPVMREPVSDSVLVTPLLARLAEIRERGGDYSEVLAARSGQRGSGTPALLGFNQAYQTRDGIIWIGAVTPRTRHAVRELLAITDDRADEPDYDASTPESVAYGQQRRDQIKSAMRDRTSAEWIEALGAVGVPVSPVQAPEELADHPQVQAEGLMTELEHAVTGPQLVVGPAVSLSATPTAVQRAAPALGQHTTEVLLDAGIGEAELESLRAAGVIA